MTVSPNIATAYQERAGIGHGSTRARPRRPGIGHYACFAHVNNPR